MFVELQDPPACIEFNDFAVETKSIFFSHDGKDGVVLEKLRHGWMQLKTGQPILEKKRGENGGVSRWRDGDSLGDELLNICLGPFVLLN